MEKTDKTMTELEIEINQKAWEYSRISESGSKLKPKFGPGYTGKICSYLYNNNLGLSKTIFFLI